MIEGSAAGSVPRTIGSGSGRPLATSILIESTIHACRSRGGDDLRLPGRGDNHHGGGGEQRAPAPPQPGRESAESAPLLLRHLQQDVHTHRDTASASQDPYGG